MLTKLGKFLRILRMDRGELLKQMADNLNIAPSYLSSIENGKREPSRDFVQKIESAYVLSGKEREQLLSAYEQTVEEVTINLNQLSEEQVDLSVVFARRLNELSDNEVDAIKKILAGSR